MRLDKRRMYAVRQVETFHPGEFNGDGDRLDVAVGMPRGANLTGKVGYHCSPLMMIMKRHIEE